MANGIRNALLFGGGVLVAAFAVAYGAGVFAPKTAEKLSEASAPADSSMMRKQERVPGASGQAATDSGAADQAAKTDAAAPAGEAGKPSDKNGKSADVTPPSFDVVRVEGSGSIVIAGKASPNAQVEILSGSSVIGTAKGGPEGDFATVLDNPLKPGDYQFVLRSTSPGNVVAMSKQTAVVSVPEHEDGQVLALVESPGEPSKLITVPKPDKAATQGATPAASDSASTTMAQANGSSARTASSAAGGAATASDNGQTVANAGAAPGEAATKPKSQTPASASATDGKPSTQEMASTETQRVAPAKSGSATPSTGQAETASQSGASSDGQAATAAQPRVSVEAVEIEGNKIFIAGVADPGSTVRVYANNTALGEAKTSPVGRFLVETIHELAVGDYIIRADMLGDDGVKVVARAAVPFTRAPGEAVSAVASADAPAKSPTGKDARVQQTNDANSATVKQGARGTNPEADKAAGKTETVMTSEPNTQGTAEAPGNSANAATGSSDGAVAATDGKAAEKSTALSADGKSQQVAEGEQGSVTLPSLENGIAQDPPTILAPKLKETNGAVIIRRGDTLWQISRRVYGHGVRYSTIYLANQKQIEDPDRIWPGQIFSVPHKTDEGETADMKAIGDQAMKMPKPAVQ